MAKKYAYWVSSGKFSMMQKIMTLILGLITFMMLARMFTPTLLGTWGLFLLISGIIETSRNALIRNGYILFVNTTEPDTHSGVEHAAFLTNISFTVLVVMFFLTSGQLLQTFLNAPHLATILYYYCLALVALLFFSQTEIFLTARLDFKSVFGMYMIRNGLLLVVVAFFFLSGQSLDIRLLSGIYAACALVGSLAGLLYKRKYEQKLRIWNKPVFRQFIKYGKFVFGNNISSLIFRNTDTFLTASFISTAASAFYSSCTRITNFADMPSQVLGDIMFPKAAQVMKKKDLGEIKALYEKTVAATLTFTLPVVLIVLLFAKYILLIIAGSQYVEAAGILRIIILYGLFLPFIRQFGNIMDVTGRPHINFMVMFSFSLINILLNILGIHLFGLPGSALGTLSSYFLLFITVIIILYRLLQISLANIFKNIFILYPDYIKMVTTAMKNILNPSYEK